MSEQTGQHHHLSDQPLNLTPGRRAPFTQVSDWVLLSGVDCEARTLYWALSAHLNASREDNEVWPSLLTLARIIGLKKPENVSKYMLQLEVIGAVEVIRTTAGLKRRNRYIVHQTPPAGYSGPQSMGDWYARYRPAEEENKNERQAREAEFDAWLADTRQTIKDRCAETSEARVRAKQNGDAVVPPVPFLGSRPRTPSGGGTGRAGGTRRPPDRSVPPRPGVRTPSAGGPVPPAEGVEVDQVEIEQEPSAAPSARSAAAGRRPPTGSGSVRTSRPSLHAGVPSACGAAGAPTDRAALMLVRTVELGLPTELRRMLPKWRPPVLRDVILQECQTRTAEQLIARADRRWYTWGLAAAADTATGGAGLAHPVGAAVRILGPYRCQVDGCGRECPDPRCEDGFVIDSGRRCPRCVEHHDEAHRSRRRRTGRREGADAVPAEAYCLDCGARVSGPLQSDGTCQDCTQAAANALASLGGIS
ncbi:hypothetical protein ACFY00_33685 [Kitasatospora sp. NPDC001540]|uniref:hypothetical protein n=1 Tax=Kitasatospora sp. NPDC001540 TaxID=3364014 RepID=UPI0036C3EF14